MQDLLIPADILQPEKPPAYSDEAASSLAGQYALAQNDPSSLEKNKYRIQKGEEPQMRREYTAIHNAVANDIHRNALNASIASGMPEAATQMIKQPYVGDPPEVAVEVGAAEAGAAIKMDSIVEVMPPRPSDVELNAKIAIANNAIAKWVSTLQEAYPLDYIGNITNGNAELSDIPLVYLGKKAYAAAAAADTPVDALGNAFKATSEEIKKVAKFGTDIIAMFMNSPEAWGKSDDTLGFVAPAEAAKEFSTILNDPNTSPEEFKRVFDIALNRYTEAFMGEYLNNPMKVVNALSEALGMGQINNEQFKKLVTTPTFTQDGQEYNNLLTEFLNPYREPKEGESTTANSIYKWLDILSINPTVTNITTTPLSDALLLTKIGSAVKATRNLVGATQTAAALQRNMASLNPNLAAMFHATQLAHPGTVVDPTILTEVNRLQQVAMETLDTIVDPVRVNLTPQDTAAVATQLRNTEFQGADLAWMTPRIDGGNNFTDIFLQSRAGTPFISEAAARIDAAARGLDNFEVIKHPNNNSFYIKISRATDEKGFLKTAPDAPEMRIIDHIFRTYTRYGGWVWTPNVTAKKADIAAASSASLQASNIAEAFDAIHAPIAALRKEEMKDLGDVLLDAQKLPNPTPTRPDNRGKWLSEQELEASYRTLVGRLPSKQEKLAYFAFRTSSDLNYALENKRLFDQAAAGGYGHWKIGNVANGEPVIAKAVTNSNKIHEEAKVLLPGGLIKKKSELKTFNFDDPENIILQVYGHYEHGGREVSHIVAKRSDAASSGLSRFILGYTEGGTRNYAGTRFVSIGRKGRSPTTIAAFMTDGAAVAYAEKINQIQDLFKRYSAELESMGNAGTLNAVTRQQLVARYNDLIQNVHSRWNISKIEKEITEGTFSIDDKAKVKYNREAAPTTGRIDSGERAQLYQFQGGLYYSERGRILTSDIDEMATLENPFRSLARQQAHATRSAAYSNFRVSRMNSWGAMYREHMHVPGVSMPTNEDVFRFGVWNEGVELDDALLARAKTEREYINRVLRQPDFLEAALEASKNNFAKHLSKAIGDSRFAKYLPDKYFESLKTGKIITEADAINALRGLAYDYHMGFLNPAHLWVQATGALIGTITHPIYGAKAATEWGFIRAASMFKFNNKLIELLDGRMGKYLGYRPGEFMQIMADYRMAGLHSIGYTDSTLDTAASVRNLSGNTVRDTRSALRAFTYEGERTARGISFGIARRLADEEVLKGTFAARTSEYYQFIRGETNRLQMNMMQGAETAWQRFPITSLGSQMLQYPFKMMEIFLGLNKQFTAKEKLSIVSSLIVMFGAYGVPGGPEFANFVLGKSAEKYGPLSEETAKTAYLGMFDKAVREIFNEDTAFAARLGPGDMFTTIYDMIAVDPVIGTLTGIAGKDLTNLSKAAGYSMILIGSALGAYEETTTEPVYMTQEILSAFGKTISSLNQATRAYYLHTYGRYMNSRFTNILDQQSAYSALLVGMGVTSGDEALSWQAYPLSMKRDAIKKDLIDVIFQQRLAIANVLANESGKSLDDKLNYHRQIIRNVMSPINQEDPDLAREIQGMVVSKMLKSSEVRAVSAKLPWVTEDRGE